MIKNSMKPKKWCEWCKKLVPYSIKQCPDCGNRSHLPDVTVYIKKLLKELSDQQELHEKIRDMLR